MKQEFAWGHNSRSSSHSSHNNNAQIEANGTWNGLNRAGTAGFQIKCFYFDSYHDERLKGTIELWILFHHLLWCVAVKIKGSLICHNMENLNLHWSNDKIWCALCTNNYFKVQFCSDEQLVNILPTLLPYPSPTSPWMSSGRPSSCLGSSPPWTCTTATRTTPTEPGTSHAEMTPSQRRLFSWVLPPWAYLPMCCWWFWFWWGENLAGRYW